MHRLDLQGEFLLRGQGVRDGHTLEICSGHAPGVHSETDYYVVLLLKLHVGEWPTPGSECIGGEAAVWLEAAPGSGSPGAVYF